MIKRLQQLADRQAIYCPDRDDHFDRLVEDGFEMITGPVSKSFGPSVIPETFKLTRFLRSESFDVLIAHQPMGALVGITAGKSAGIPAKIYSTGGLKYVADAGGISNNLVKRGEVKIMNWADAVLLVNKEDRLTLRDLPVSQPKIHYVGPRGGCGIDTAVFNPQERDRYYASSRQQLGLQRKHIAVGFVGRCVWEKGLRELAEAAAILTREPSGRNLRFCILGNGSDLDEFKQLVASLGVSEQFVFPGYLPEIHKFVAAFDIFILPSYREGLPISLLEAQAMGIPSVATNVRGSRELVENGNKGLLVECRDPQALATALQQLVDNPEVARQLAEAATENVRDNYSEAALLPRTIDLIQTTFEVATRPGTSRP